MPNSGLNSRNRPGPADSIDARLLLALTGDPRATTIALAERTGVSRNTVQARLNRWHDAGALLPFDRRIDPGYLGYPLRAYVLTHVKQRRLGEVSAALREVPEVIEVHGLSGAADLLIQVVARTRMTCTGSRAGSWASRGSGGPALRWSCANSSTIDWLS